MIEYLVQEAIGMVVVGAMLGAAAMTVGPALSMGAIRGLRVWNDSIGPALVIVLTLSVGALVLAKDGGPEVLLKLRLLVAVALVWYMLTVPLILAVLGIRRHEMEVRHRSLSLLAMATAMFLLLAFFSMPAGIYED